MNRQQMSDLPAAWNDLDKIQEFVPMKDPLLHDTRSWGDIAMEEEEEEQQQTKPQEEEDGWTVVKRKK